MFRSVRFSENVDDLCRKSVKRGRRGIRRDLLPPSYKIETESTRGGALQKYQRMLSEGEKLFARWLADLGCEARQGWYLVYEQAPPNHKITLRYREIDCLVGAPDAPELLIELKFSTHVEGVGSIGRRQIRRSVKIARARWPRLHGTVVLLTLSPMLLGDEIPDRVMTLQRLGSELVDRSALIAAPPDPDDKPLLRTAHIDAQELFEYSITRGYIPHTWIDELKNAYAELAQETIAAQRLEAGPPRSWEFADSSEPGTMKALLKAAVQQK